MQLATEQGHHTAVNLKRVLSVRRVVVRPNTLKAKPKKSKKQQQQSQHQQHQQMYQQHMMHQGMLASQQNMMGSQQNIMGPQASMAASQQGMLPTASSAPASGNMIRLEQLGQPAFAPINQEPNAFGQVQVLATQGPSLLPISHGAQGLAPPPATVMTSSIITGPVPTLVNNE